MEKKRLLLKAKYERRVALLQSFLCVLEGRALGDGSDVYASIYGDGTHYCLDDDDDYQLPVGEPAPHSIGGGAPSSSPSSFVPISRAARIAKFKGAEEAAAFKALHNNRTIDGGGAADGSDRGVVAVGAGDGDGDGEGETARLRGAVDNGITVTAAGDLYADATETEGAATASSAFSINDGYTNHTLRSVADVIDAMVALRAYDSTNALPIIAVLIREARGIVAALALLADFIVSAGAMIAVLHALCIVGGLPLLITPGATVISLYALIPLQAMATPLRVGVPNAEAMGRVIARHNFWQRSAIFKHKAVLFLLQYVPTALVLFFLGALLLGMKLAALRVPSPTSPLLFSQEAGMAAITTVTTQPTNTTLPPPHEASYTTAFPLWSAPLLLLPEADKAAVRSFITMLATLALSVHSLTHASRHKQITLDPRTTAAEEQRLFTVPQRSRRWLAVSLCTNLLGLLLQQAAIYPVRWEGSIAAGGHAGHSPSMFKAPWTVFGLVARDVPAYVWLPAVLLLPLLIIAIDRPVKRWRARRFGEKQKYRKLDFGTKLGMHSPQGDYEPDPLRGGGGATSAAAASDPQYGTSGEDGSGDMWEQKGFWPPFIVDFFVRFLSVEGGRMERQCVCCPHRDGGQQAKYQLMNLA